MILQRFISLKKKKPDVDIEFTEEGVLQYFDVHMYLFFLF